MTKETNIKTLYSGAQIGDVIQFELNGDLFDGVVCMRVGNQYRVHAMSNGVSFRATVRPVDIVNNLAQANQTFREWTDN